MFSAVLRDYLVNTDAINVRFFPFLKALLFCPGFQLVLLCRLQILLRKGGRVGRVFALILWRSVSFLFGCQISPLAKLGKGIKFPHPTAIVIGAGVTIEDDVTIYQSVTVGAKSAFDLSYPIIKAGTIVYPGAVIVGEIVIECGAVVAPNSVVLSNVPAFDVVSGVPASSIVVKAS